MARPTAAGEDPIDASPYRQPTPRRLYVHDDLREEVARRFGENSTAAALARSLLGVVARDTARVRVITLAEQVGRLAGGGHTPFAQTLAIGCAGAHVAAALHARTGWFPRVRTVGLTREEDGRGAYRLVTTTAVPLRRQLAGLDGCASIAVVDDTVFSGLTMRTLLETLPAAALARTRAFCARGAAESIAGLAALCPISAGVAAPGRLLDEVSFINASGLVCRVAIRRRGAPPLAFFDRPEWIRAWFPGSDGEVLALCRRLNALLEPPEAPRDGEALAG